MPRVTGSEDAQKISGDAPPPYSAPSWERVLRERLAVYGHRNWIVVADSAYPAQARPGVETIAADAGQIHVLRKVLAALAEAKHVRPVIYTDAELPLVQENDAPGINAFRRSLAALVKKSEIQTLPHEEIIAKLDAAAGMFCVLVIKTNMACPYTSVFLELDCRYWTPDAEKQLRDAMAAVKQFSHTVE